MKSCPACAETIPEDVATCPHCGISLHEYAEGEDRRSGRPTWSPWLIVGLIAVGCVGLLAVCIGIPAALIFPATQQAREAARRSQCKNNLKQIGLALHTYNDMYGTLPPAFVADENGKPMHSWRVLILPFLDEKALYDEYSFAEPWDGPHNSRLLARMPRVYACPSDPATGGNTLTAYAGVFGEHCLFRGAEPVAFKDVSDELSNTLLVGEVKASIPWMKPEDVDIKLNPSVGAAQGFGSFHVGGANFLLGDGTVRFINQNVSRQTLDALFTRDGNEPLGDY